MEKRSVRRLLRRRDTLEYFKGDGWTSDPNQAVAFIDVVEAAQVCVKHGLVNIELALHIEGTGSEVFCTALR